jgi:hypothetical protein
MSGEEHVTHNGVFRSTFFGNQGVDASKIDFAGGVRRWNISTRQYLTQFYE